MDPKQAAQGFEEKEMVHGGKRLAVTWAPWMEDWFCSHSPRNCNANAEGPWFHWAQMAAQILAHPLTRIVAPDLYRPDLPWRYDIYSDNPRPATPEEICAAEHEHRRNIQAMALGLPLTATDEDRERAIAASREKRGMS